MRILAVLAFLLCSTIALRSEPARAAPGPGETFHDCTPNCPEMVVVPAGTFQMGSSDEETTREAVENEFAVWEKPVHSVTIAKPFAVGKFAVTWAEFNAFAKETGYNTTGCLARDTKAGKYEYDDKKSWKDPGFPQTNLSQPVVCVAWDDAMKYVAWLSAKSGQQYRLLSESEWEFAARAGTMTVRYWGDAIGSGNTNCGDCGSRWDFKQTAPSGSFKPNGFGLYDMVGNAYQWTGDCWNESYDGAPKDGSITTTGDCNRHAVRGGSWLNGSREVRAAHRFRLLTGIRFDNIGFRVARTLP